MSVNPIFLQKVLRENASDLHDFSKDLKSWGEEMKRKEGSTKSQDVKPTPSNKVRKVQKKTTPKNVERKIGSTDYNKWEKFDADAELDRLDDDIDDDSELTDECNENMYDEAIVEKEKGNKFVKNQNWDEAIKCYSKAIECYSYDPIFYANRALCYLKKNKFEEAERDCNLSLKLDSKYVKALQRRAAARVALDKLEDAELDFLRVLEIEPKNKESKAELAKVRNKLNKVEKCVDQRPVSKFTASRNKSNTSATPTHEFVTNHAPSGVASQTESKLTSPWPDSDGIILVKPIKKPPHLQSKKPLKRIEIVEVDSSVEANVDVLHAEEAVKDRVIEKKEKVPDIAIKEHIEKVVPTEQIEEPPKIVSAFKKNKAFKNSTVTQATTVWPTAQENVTVVSTDNLKIIERSQETENKLIASDKETMENNFSAPKNSVQFNSTWKTLKSHNAKYKYMKSIDPLNLPKIFLESLDATIFSNILEVLAEEFIKNEEHVYDILESFTNVKRFSAMTLFLTNDDKRNLWKLFDYLRQNNESDKNTIDMLIDKYEI